MLLKQSHANSVLFYLFVSICNIRIYWIVKKNIILKKNKSFFQSLTLIKNKCFNNVKNKTKYAVINYFRQFILLVFVKMQVTVLQNKKCTLTYIRQR